MTEKVSNKHAIDVTTDQFTKLSVGVLTAISKSKIAYKTLVEHVKY